jgi:hypothetical protein
VTTCKACQDHVATMQRVWRGLSKLQRARLAAVPKDAAHKPERALLVASINHLVAKMQAPLAPCRWSGA